MSRRLVIRFRIRHAQPHQIQDLVRHRVVPCLAITVIVIDFPLEIANVHDGALIVLPFGQLGQDFDLQIDVLVIDAGDLEALADLFFQCLETILADGHLGRVRLHEVAGLLELLFLLPRQFVNAVHHGIVFAGAGVKRNQLVGFHAEKEDDSVSGLLTRIRFRVPPVEGPPRPCFCRKSLQHRRSDPCRHRASGLQDLPADSSVTMALGFLLFSEVTRLRKLSMLQTRVTTNTEHDGGHRTGQDGTQQVAAETLDDEAAHLPSR